MRSEERDESSPGSSNIEGEFAVSELRSRRRREETRDGGIKNSKSLLDDGTSFVMKDSDDVCEHFTESNLSLVEQILLLGLKDKEGYTSFWNDDISTGLRGAILVELALRARIRLEPCGLRRRPLLSRRVLSIDTRPTGDAILDEALRQIAGGSQEPVVIRHSIPTWISFLSGDSWNPFNLRFRIKNVRERIAKSLVEKGVCGTGKQNFLVFDMTTHPLLPNSEHKGKLIESIQQSVLSNWNPNVRKFNVRALALIFLAHASDVIDNAFLSLNHSDFEIAGKRIRQLIALDPEQEATTAAAAAADSGKHNDHQQQQQQTNNVQQTNYLALEVLWAVVAALNK